MDSSTFQASFPGRPRHASDRGARLRCLIGACLSCLAGIWPALANSVLTPGATVPNQREVACILVVRRAPEISWPDGTTVISLLQTSAVADVPARDVLGMDPELRAQKVHFQVNVITQDRADLSLSLRITLDIPQGVPEYPGWNYLNAVMDRFQDALGDLRKNRSTRVEAELQSASDELTATEKELAEGRQALKALDEKIGMQFAGPNELRMAPANIHGEINNILYYLESLQRTTEQAAISADEERRRDEEAWRKVVDLREAKLPELQRLAAEGKVDPLELAEFEARLAEARARARVAPQGMISGTLPFRSRGNFPSDPEAPKKMAEEKMKELEGLLDRLQRVEKLDLRGLATEMESLEKEQHRLGEKRETLAAQVEKARLELKGLSAVSLEVFGK